MCVLVEFVLQVLAGVVVAVIAHAICKWLDRDTMQR